MQRLALWRKGGGAIAAAGPLQRARNRLWLKPVWVCNGADVDEDMPGDFNRVLQVGGAPHLAAGHVIGDHHQQACGVDCVCVNFMDGGSCCTQSCSLICAC